MLTTPTDFEEKKLMDSLQVLIALRDNRNRLSAVVLAIGAPAQ